MKKENEKEVALECVEMINSGMRQVFDAIERLDKIGVKVCDTFHSADSYEKAHGTAMTVQVYKGIGKLATLVEKEKEMFHPRYYPGYGEPRKEEDKLAIAIGDVLWFELGKTAGYEFP